MHYAIILREDTPLSSWDKGDYFGGVCACFVSEGCPLGRGLVTICAETQMSMVGIRPF